MPTSPSKATRSSFRLAKLPPPPSSPSLFLSLPPETLDQVLQFAVAKLSTRNRRLQLASFLRIHPSLTPIVRRRLYNKTTLNVGDPKGSDREFVELLETVEAGRYVNFAKIRVPDPDSSKEKEEDFDADPALSILPAPRLDQKETVDMLAQVFEKVIGLRYLELDIRVATRVEGDPIPSEGDDEVCGGKVELARLEASMSSWKSTLETFIYNLADPYQRLQIFSDASVNYQSPFVGALQSWNSLTHLELWRVKLALPPDTALPEFKLKTLRLRDGEFGSAFELKWLVNDSSVLSNLVLEDLAFTSTPQSSSPFLGVLSPNHSPTFSHSLKNFQLQLLHPIGEPTPRNILSSLVNLENLLLGGAGVDLPLFASIFPPLSNVNTSETRYPSQNLRTLTLRYLVHPSLVYSDYTPPLDTIQPRTFHNTLLTHLFTPRSVPNLRSITLQPTGEFPRQFTWAQRRGVPLPMWSLSNISMAFQDEADAWYELESPLRKVTRQRRRENFQRGGGTGGESGPIKLFKNRLEIDYADDLSDGEGNEDEEEEEEVFDADALFVPPSSDDEAPIVNAKRDPDSDSDF